MLDMISSEKDELTELFKCGFRVKWMLKAEFKEEAISPNGQEVA